MASAAWNLRVSASPTMMAMTRSCRHFNSLHTRHLSFSFRSYPPLNIPCKSCIVHARKKSSPPQPVLKPQLVEDVSVDEGNDIEIKDMLMDDEDGEMLDDDDFFEDEYLEEDPEPSVGDGEGGGGISLAGTLWDKEALTIAEEVSLSLEGNLRIYSFKTLAHPIIRVRIETLSNKSGSPSMADIEAFTRAFRKRLDEAEISGLIPENISLEISSPGVERVVRIPQDLDRFKDRPMYVRYVSEVDATVSSAENDGIFRLVSFDLEMNCCTWGIADVRVNREKAGKGRPLNKKQREWRLETPFNSLRLVRIYSDI